MYDGNGGIVMPFLDTLEKGIAKAKDFGERNRLLGEINVREMHKKECLTALGEQYYDALKHGVTPDCSVLYQELQTVDQELCILQRESFRLPAHSVRRAERSFRGKTSADGAVRRWTKELIIA